MSFTLLTQQEIEQIPNIIYKKILIEYNNVIEYNNNLNKIITQNKYIINDCQKQIEKHKVYIYNINITKAFIEIENEFCKLRIESLSNILDILIDDCEKKNTKKNEVYANSFVNGNANSFVSGSINGNANDSIHNKYSAIHNKGSNIHNNANDSVINNNNDSANDSMNTMHSSSKSSKLSNISVIQKLIKKINKLSKKYKKEKKRHEKIFTKFCNLIKVKDHMYDQLCKNTIENKKIDTCNEILNKSIFLENNYFAIFDKCNKLEYENNLLGLENKKLKYKYDRYILTNREDIIPVIGRELETIKDSLYRNLQNIDFLDAYNIFCEFWKFIEVLKQKIEGYKKKMNFIDKIKEEVHNIKSAYNDVSRQIQDNTELFYSFKVEMLALNELTQLSYKPNNQEILYNVDNLLLEIYANKKKINKKEQELQEQNKKLIENIEIIKTIENDNNEKDKTINEIKRQLEDKEDLIQKMTIIIEKLKKIRTAYNVLKCNMSQDA